ncbi:MAG: sulfotransferase family protein [Nocardioidaceae bacterium]
MTVDRLRWPEVRDYYTGLRPATYLLALPDQGVIYVKNPKAGCSTLLAWLDRIHTGDWDTPRTGNIHVSHQLPRIRDVGRGRVMRMLSGAAYRFTFVRDPLRRLESVYWDKFVHSQSWGTRSQVKDKLPVGPDGRIAFEAFLDLIEQQDPLTEMDPHWRPQHVNLLHPLVHYDRIGRLESFADDLDLISQEAGLPPVPRETRNTTRSREASVYDGRPDLVARVQALYALDFELYGY